MPLTECKHWKNSLENSEEKLQSFENHRVVLGGDFNGPLSSADKIGGRDISTKKNVIAKINEMINNFDLVDVWGNCHPKVKLILLGLLPIWM